MSDKGKTSYEQFSDDTLRGCGILVLLLLFAVVLLFAWAYVSLMTQ